MNRSKSLAQADRGRAQAALFGRGSLTARVSTSPLQVRWCWQQWEGVGILQLYFGHMSEQRTFLGGRALSGRWTTRTQSWERREEAGLVPEPAVAAEFLTKPKSLSSI